MIMRTLSNLALLTALVSGCGVDDRLTTNGDSNNSADATAGMQFDHVVHPPKEYYDAAFLDAVNDDGQFGLATGTPDVLFVNFDGAQLTKGFGPGQSFILCNQQATVPASGLSTADRQEILAAVQKFYSDVKANLSVTATKPTQGAFTTIHVGGSYRDLGCLGNGILGVAPFDVRDSNKSDIGFAFVPNNISNTVIAETIAHEAGHSYGLDHVVTQQDLMFASSSPGITGFLVSRTGGGAIQDAPAMLQQALGLAGTVAPAPTAAPAPTVTIPTAVPTATPVAGGPTKIPTANAPGGIPGLANIPNIFGGLPGLGQIGAIGAILPTLLGGVAGGAGGFDISKILAGFAGGAAGGAGGAAGFDISKILGQFAGGAGGAAGFDPTKLIGQLGGLLGAGGAGGLPAGLAGILGGAAGGAGGLPAILAGVVGGGGGLPAGLPDLSKIFGLGQGIPDLGALIKGLNGTKRVVALNYSGAERAAMMDIVKLAYAQRYEELTQP
jgi:hypothetical protein